VDQHTRSAQLVTRTRNTCACVRIYEIHFDILFSSLDNSILWVETAEEYVNVKMFIQENKNSHTILQDTTRGFIQGIRRKITLV